MWLAYLPINQAWVFLFGQSIEEATILDMDGQRFFPSRQEAKSAAKRCGLTVDRRGNVAA